MISLRKTKRFCKDDITKIKNYNEAINDKDNIWHCHHLLELTLDNEPALSVKDLIRMNMYYNRPYFELIFLNPKAHHSLHNKGKKHSDSSKLKRSIKLKGLKRSKTQIERNRISHQNKLISDFSVKFYEKYKMYRYENVRFYDTEHNWYKRHKKCRWE